jgi:hypothetical protein
MTTNYREHATKPVTPTMQAFADFVKAEVYGGELPKGLSEEAFVRAIALGGSLRMQFQKSEMWRSDPRNYLANVEANRERKAREAVERAEESARKAKARVEAAKAKAAAAVKAAEAKAAAAKAKAEEAAK